MKFTKTLIVIAIVLGLMAMCIVGCFADFNFCTVISPNGIVPIVNKYPFGEIVIDNSAFIADEIRVTINGVDTIIMDVDGVVKEMPIYCRTMRLKEDNSIYSQTYGVKYYSGLIPALLVKNGDIVENQINDPAIWEYLNIEYEKRLDQGETDRFLTQFEICTYNEKGENEDMTVVEQILAVFTAVGNWFAEIIPGMLSVFYSTETNTLTVIGVLAVCSLAIAVILLVLAWVCDFFKFRK